MRYKMSVALILAAGLILMTLNIPISKSNVFFDPKPDLECEGSLCGAADPGARVTGSFEVKNVGDAGSLLDWEIVEYPDWGTWTFMPSSGIDLPPEHGALTVIVEIIAPFEENTNVEGYVKVENSENSSDFDVVPVKLTTGSYIKIIKPEKALYINNKKIMPFIVPLIVGSIDIDVTACSIIDTVEFYIDGELQHTDATQPFSWIWDELVFFRHTITIVALNNSVGINSSREVKVWKFT